MTSSCTSCQVSTGVGVIPEEEEKVPRQPHPRAGTTGLGPKEQLPFAKSSKSIKYFSHTTPAGSSGQVYEVRSNIPFYSEGDQGSVRWDDFPGSTQLESGSSNVRICISHFLVLRKGKGRCWSTRFPFSGLSKPFSYQTPLISPI